MTTEQVSQSVLSDGVEIGDIGDRMKSTLFEPDEFYFVQTRVP